MDLSTAPLTLPATSWIRFPASRLLLGSVVGELFDVLGDVSRLIGRLVSQPAELVGILVDVRGGPTAT
jgi:hypothetical protein